jgi:hypothetical protein
LGLQAQIGLIVVHQCQAVSAGQVRGQMFSARQTGDQPANLDVQIVQLTPALNFRRLPIPLVVSE